MKYIIIVFVSIILIGFYSCKEKTYYGTSLAFENQMNDSIFLILYPKEVPYSNMTNYKMKKSESKNIYWESCQNKIPSDIIKAVFDSIVINYKDKMIIFSTATVIGYNANLYHENELWESKMVEYDEPDNFNRNHHEDIVFTFSLIETMLQND